MIWYVMIDGLPVDARTLSLELQMICAEKGLIPYVPALKDKKDSKEEPEEQG